MLLRADLKTKLFLIAVFLIFLSQKMQKLSEYVGKRCVLYAFMWGWVRGCEREGEKEGKKVKG